MCWLKVTTKKLTKTFQIRDYKKAANNGHRWSTIGKNWCYIGDAGSYNCSIPG